MRLEYDNPLDFEAASCKVCGKNDEDWHVMHFLADGQWRTLQRGQTLREQGIDEKDSERLFCVHACTEPILRSFVSMREVQIFMDSLRKR